MKRPHFLKEYDHHMLDYFVRLKNQDCPKVMGNESQIPEGQGN
jgi:hypothetical protein